MKYCLYGRVEDIHGHSLGAFVYSFHRVSAATVDISVCVHIVMQG